MRSTLSSAGTLCLMIMFSLCAGCTVNNEEAVKKILDKDPSFQKWINEKNDIQKKISADAKVYNENERKIASQIIALKKKKSDLKTKYLVSVEKMQKQLEPERRRLEQKLTEMYGSLRQKEADIDNINRDIGEVSALIGKQNRLEMTREEMKVWNKRRTDLIKRKGNVGKEIADLKENIEITKLKIKVLKIK